MRHAPQRQAAASALKAKCTREDHPARPPAGRPEHAGLNRMVAMGLRHAPAPAASSVAARPARAAAPQLPVSRQGAVRPNTIVQGPAAWTAADYSVPGAPGRFDADRFALQLTERHVDELERAIDTIERHPGGLSAMHRLAREQLPLPTLAPALAEARRQVVHGRGFAVLRGVPAGPGARFTKAQTQMAFYVLGLHMGAPRSNNKDGDLMAHVTSAVGKDSSSKPAAAAAPAPAPADNKPPHNYGSRSNAKLPAHVDMADLLFLACMQPAAEGGESSFCSSVSVHNHVLAESREAAALLAQPHWCYDRPAFFPPASAADPAKYFRFPVFNHHDGQLVTAYSGHYFRLARANHPDELPPFTAEQLEALALFDEVACRPELRLDHTLAAGEVLVLHNHTAMHARSSFRDSGVPGEERHLLRMYLAPRDGWDLPPALEGLYNNTRAPGARGGVDVPADKLRILDAPPLAA